MCATTDRNSSKACRTGHRRRKVDGALPAEDPVFRSGPVIGFRLPSREPPDRHRRTVAACAVGRRHAKFARTRPTISALRPVPRYAKEPQLDPTLTYQLHASTASSSV